MKAKGTIIQRHYLCTVHGMVPVVMHYIGYAGQYVVKLPSGNLQVVSHNQLVTNTYQR